MIVVAGNVVVLVETETEVEVTVIPGRLVVLVVPGSVTVTAGAVTVTGGSVMVLVVVACGQ